MAYTTINDPTQYFNTVLYTGNNVDDRSITGVGFQPDFMWSKERNSTGNHVLVDSTRGATKVLQGNLTNDEATVVDGFQAFESDGFQVGAANSTNETGVNYVNWCWLANGGTTSSNTDGSITSTVQANTTSGFSIVTYTATGSNATVGHGLGVAPKMIIVKNREIVKNWGIWHEGLGGGDKYIKLNTTDTTTTATDIWNNTVPTSTVFSIGTASVTNTSGDGHIAYCFAPIKGYSKFGSYIGNGSTDGPFVYTGFKPAFIISKGLFTKDWTMVDNKRNSYNVVTKELFPNQNYAETTNDRIDFVSNGFKVTSSGAQWNSSGATFIYMAWAESPFVSSDGVPTTAR